MKNKVIFVVCILLVLSFSLVSALWFGNFLNKITGKVIQDNDEYLLLVGESVTVNGKTVTLQDVNTMGPGTTAIIEVDGISGRLSEEGNYPLSKIINGLEITLLRIYYDESYPKDFPAVNVILEDDLPSRGSYAILKIVAVKAQTCTDSDGGLNYYVKGTATQGTRSETDFCVSDIKLSEALCNKDNNPAYTQFNCPNGCVDGACVPENKTTEEIVDASISIATLKDSYKTQERVELTDPPDEVGYNGNEINEFIDNSISPREFTQSSIQNEQNIITESRVDSELTNINGYIIQFKDEPIIVKKVKLEKKAEGNKDSFLAKIPIIKRFILTPEKVSDEIKDYSDELDNKNQIIKNKILNKLNKNSFVEITGNAVKEESTDDKLNVLGEFNTVFNGIALDVTAEESEKLKEISEIKEIYPNYEVNATLMDSVQLINANDVWQLDKDGNNCVETGKDCLTGKGIIIAIIDTGVDYTHPDLGGCFGRGCKVIGGYDFVNNDADPMDDQGHGTHCAGIAAGNGSLKGVAPDAKIYAYKVLDSGGSGTMSGVISGIEMAIDPNLDGNLDDSVDIISMSLGGSGNPDDAISQSVDNAVDAGVVIVIAAGNSGPSEQTIRSPGTARKAITVGASDKTDNIAYFSSRGLVIWTDEERNEKAIIKPDVVAPGVDICAAQYDSAWDDRKCFDDKHIAISGTSMATPHVAGAVALLKQKNPNWTPEEIKAALKNTAVDLGEDIITQGYGRINIAEAVGLEEPSVVELYTSGKITKLENIGGKIIDNNFQNYQIFLEDKDKIETLIYSSNLLPQSNVLMEKFNPYNYEDRIYYLKLVETNNRGEKSKDTTIVIIDNLFITNEEDLKFVGDFEVVIEGNTALPDYSQYKVEIKKEDSNDWIKVTQGDKIKDNTLGILNLSNYEEGTYVLRFSVYYNNRWYAEEIIINKINGLRQGWPIKTETVLRGLEVIDMDNDNESEIGITTINELFGKDGEFYLIDNNGKFEVVHKRIIKQDPYFEAWLGEDLIKFSKTNKIVLDGIVKGVFNKEGFFVDNWPNWLKGDISSSNSIIYDINGDGEDELISYYINPWDKPERSLLKVFNDKGDVLDEITIGEECISWLSSKLRLVNEDEILLSTSFLDEESDNYKSCNFIYNFKNKQITFSEIKSTPRENISALGWGIEEIYVADFDLDGRNEIVSLFLERDKKTELKIYKQNGEKWFEYNSIETYESPYYFYDMILANIDEDSEPEIIFIKDSVIKAYNYDGTEALESLFIYENYAEQLKSLIAGDIDDDGDTEIIASYESYYWVGGKYKVSAGVKIYNSDGSLRRNILLTIPGKNLGYWNRNGLLLGDINNDGKTDLIFSVDEYEGSETVFPETNIFFFELGTPYKKENMEWPMFQHDPQHTGCYDCDKKTPPIPERPQSKIVNNENIDLTGYLTIKIQKKNISNNWQNYQIVIDNIQETIPTKGLIKLDKIFNPIGFIPTEIGNYRIVAEFKDKDGNLIKTRDGELKASWEFTVEPRVVKRDEENNNSKRKVTKR